MENDPETGQPNQQGHRVTRSSTSDADLVQGTPEPERLIRQPTEAQAGPSAVQQVAADRATEAPQAETSPSNEHAPEDPPVQGEASAVPQADAAAGSTSTATPLPGRTGHGEQAEAAATPTAPVTGQPSAPPPQTLPAQTDDVPQRTAQPNDGRSPVTNQAFVQLMTGMLMDSTPEARAALLRSIQMMETVSPVPRRADAIQGAVPYVPGVTDRPNSPRRAQKGGTFVTTTARPGSPVRAQPTPFTSRLTTLPAEELAPSRGTASDFSSSSESFDDRLRRVVRETGGFPTSKTAAHPRPVRSQPVSASSAPHAETLTDEQTKALIRTLTESDTFIRTLAAVSRHTVDHLVGGSESVAKMLPKFYDNPEFVRWIKEMATDTTVRILHDRAQFALQGSALGGPQSVGRSQPQAWSEAPSARRKNKHDYGSSSNSESSASHAPSSTAPPHAPRTPDAPMPYDTARPPSRGASSVDIPIEDEAMYDRDYEEEDISRLSPLRPTNDLYVQACDFRTYRLENKNSRYNKQDSKNVKRFLKDLNVQLRNQHFNGSNPIQVLTFLREFRDACNTNGVHEGAARWLFQFFLDGTAKANLARGSARTGRALSSARSGSKDGMTYCQAVQYLLRVYATDDAIATAHMDISQFKIASNSNELKYAQELLSKAYKCGDVYPMNVLRGYYVEGSHESIRGALRSYLSKHPDCDVLELAYEAKNVGAISRGRGHSDNKEDNTERTDKKKQNRGNRGKNRDKGDHKNDGHQVAAVTPAAERPSHPPTAPSLPSSVALTSTLTPPGPSPANAVFAVGNPQHGYGAPSSSYTTTTHYSGAPSAPPARTGDDATPCRLCLALGCSQYDCPLLPSETREALNRQREENLQKLRSLGYYDRPRNRSRSRSPGAGTHRSYSTKQGLPPVDRHGSDQKKA